MTPHAAVTRSTYAGLFLVALATLMYEILLTRIFSVTMWYHFAFVAISVAMFGMTVGALVVYVRPAWFPHERVHQQLALSSLLFPVSIVFSFLTQLSVPFVIHPSIVGVYSVGFTYAVIAVPFVVSGVLVCLALTRFPRHVSQLYAADLAGAAIGCVLVIYTLRVTDGPTAVFVVASLASLGAWCFAAGSGSRSRILLAGACTLSLVAFASGHTILVWKQFPVLRVMYIKGAREIRPLYEKWNSFSRVRVHGRATEPEKPFGWGLSSTYPMDRTVYQLGMDIDVNAGTVLTRFRGNLNEVPHLKFDVTNIGYYIRPEADVLVIGTGGGRDVLSALAFGARSVVGVELNENILDAANKRFGDFTGHLDRHPRVRFVHDEARSYIARHDRRYDVIQVSLIDTWAATAAGAFVLSENSLYTVEAWKIFLEHLTDAGVLTVSRWYFKDRPGEVYRLAALASASLARVGVGSPRDHVVIVRNMRRGDRGDAPDGVGTLLVSRAPFSDHDLDRLEDVSASLAFEVALSRRVAVDATLGRLVSGRDLEAITAAFPINIAPPTDDSPFFFHMLRLRDIFKRELWEQGRSSFNMKAVFVLGVLLLTVIGLTILCILTPLALTSTPATLTGSAPLLTFFAAIGLGFMLVETSQMQRLIVVLGHPTYGLSVVLFALLVSSGFGSYLTRAICAADARRAGITRLAILLGVLAAFGAITPAAVRAFEGATTTVRIAVAVLVLALPGLFMGMAFPLGMKLASTRSASLTPWLWGVNGATSVCASVLAVAIALSATISAAFWAGCVSYAVALGALVWMEKGSQPGDR